MDIRELHSFQLSDAVKFHDHLNPKIFHGQHVRPEVEKQLKLIAGDFLEELGVDGLDVQDITISGSNAAYSYTPHSDLDLHILVDMTKLHNDEMYRELFAAKKNAYNDSHDIKIHGIPVELYIQDSNEPVISLGEYSIKNNKWLKIPSKRRANFDQNATRKKYEKLLEVIQRALKTQKLDRVQNVLHTIKRYRQAGLDKGGEFGPENLAYKALRSQGWITALYNLRDELHSKELSIEGMYAENNKFLNKPTPTIEQLVIKYKVPKRDILIQLDKGIKVELEHTKDRDIAREIALDHINEDPHYYNKLEKVGLEESAGPVKYVTRVDMTPIADFESDMKTYYGTDDWHESGLEKKANFTQSMKGLYAGEPHRTALYASGNASKTRFLEMNDPKTGQPVVYFDKKDIPRIRNTKTYVSVFDASRFKKLPTGEYFSENPGKPLKQIEVTDPFQYMMNNGWVVRVTDDIQKVFKQAQKLHKAGKIDHYGGENLTEAYGDSEIHNYRKLDRILEKLCKMVVDGQNSDKDYGMVGACVLDPDNNIVAGLNMPSKNGKRIHAERVAVEKYERKYGKVPEGSIIVTTLSPCNEPDDETAADREGRSCTDYLNGKGIKKVYCGYIDTTQDNDQRQFNLMETNNEDIREECKSFADTFLKQDINEAFDQPYPIKWEKSEYGDYDAMATLPDGKPLTIMFDHTTPYEVTITFWRNNNLELTGEGDSQRVFATVLQAIQEFLKIEQPANISFSASKEVEPGQKTMSRSRLYDKLVKRYAQQWGYNAQTFDHGEGVEFNLSRKQNVAEASGYIPSEKQKNDPRFKTALTVDVKPDSIKKNAKAFSWLTNRAGIPPTANPSGKF